MAARDPCAPGGYDLVRRLSLLGVSSTVRSVQSEWQRCCIDQNPRRVSVPKRYLSSEVEGAWPNDSGCVRTLTSPSTPPGSGSPRSFDS